MVEPREAVERASKAIRDLYNNENISTPELEEIEMSDDGKYWLVTVGFTNKSSPALALIGGYSLPNKKMKRVKIDRNSGEFRGMTIRQPDVE